MRETVDDLKGVLDELGYEYTPKTLEEVAAVKEKLGGMPAVLEEYFLKIGWFDEIADSGAGVHFRDLDELLVLTADAIRSDLPGKGENEVDDYLLFGTEAVSVDTFAVKCKEMELPNPPVYIWGDSTHHEAVEKGLIFDRVESLQNMSDFIELVALSAEEA